MSDLEILSGCDIDDETKRQNDAELKRIARDERASPGDRKAARLVQNLLASIEREREILQRS